MFTLKKSLLLLFFIGTVSSFCGRGKRQNEEEDKMEDIKRAAAPRRFPPPGFRPIRPVRIRPIC
uniref:Pleurain-E-Re n=1 Tax=Pelophylax lessonae TaxID=45623 RepID=A0A109R126_PELLE|nr:pleurain-E-Re precursor [Pelophylax lessonae]